MRTARQYGLTIGAFRALPQVDQQLALALTTYEDRIDPATGEDIRYATHPALAEFWSTVEPTKNYAHEALLAAQEQVKDAKHPETYRHMLGLREGWEDALATWGEGAASDEQGDDAEREQ